MALLSLGVPPASAEPPAAIQYGFEPLPSASGENSLNGMFPGAQDELLPQRIRDQLTGRTGAQLLVVATSPQLGAPVAGIPVPRSFVDDGDTGWLLPALLVLLASGLVTVFLLRRQESTGSRWTRVRLGAVGIAASAIVVLAVASVDSTEPTVAKIPAPPAGFFGVVSQETLGAEDVERMRKGGIESVRAAVQWGVVNPSAGGAYRWSVLDQVVSIAASQGLKVLPFLYGTPPWLGDLTTLPVDTQAQRDAWQAFLRAAVQRYRPGGEFWEEHGPGSADPVPELPIRHWQIWNEANLFYFAKPASPRRYADLLKISAPVIRAEDPGAEIVLSGLLGHPVQPPPLGLAAGEFLRRLYATPGIERDFDAVALHPYAPDAETLQLLVSEVRSAMADAGDEGTRLWLTEMGWGSQKGGTEFEKGLEGQEEELVATYQYLLSNQDLLNVERAYWFSWQDPPPPPACNFCDSVGLFEAGSPLEPKPAWFALMEFTRGDP